MASPQLEKGFVRIADELLEALYRSSFNGTEFALVLWIIRHSYGWNRKEIPAMTQREIAASAALPLATSMAAFRKLLSGRVILASDTTIKLNKDYDQWHKNQAKKVINNVDKSEKNDPKTDHRRSENGSRVIRKRITGDPKTDHYIRSINRKTERHSAKPVDRATVDNSRLLEMRNPWGRYRGVTIVNLPVDYCQWALSKDNPHRNTIGKDLECAFKARIALKQSELIPALRKSPV